MAMTLPVLRCSGLVRSVEQRTVPAMEAAPLQRDPETGRVTKQAVEAREAYEVLDVTILTDLGFAEVIVKPETLVLLNGGAVPNKNDQVDWPVWTSIGYRQTNGINPTTGGAMYVRFVRLSVPHEYVVAQHAAENSRGLAAAV